MLVNELI